MMARLLAVWHARNLEFVRDRPTLIFTLLLPVMLVIGMSFVFGGPERPLFKVGVLGQRASTRRRTPSCRSAMSTSCPCESLAEAMR